jgi:hypothetical protein
MCEHVRAEYDRRQLKMSITEDDIQFVEHHLPIGFQQEEEALCWFSPSFLSSVNRHPLDDTIQYTTKRSFYVRWFEKNSDQRHDDSTASVTSLMTYGNKHPSDARHTPTTPDDRRMLGVHAHRWIECILNGLPMYTNTSFQKQFCEYYNAQIQGRFLPWRTEMAIRSASDLRVVGVVDALFMDVDVRSGHEADGTLVLHLKDWKYSQNVVSCLDEYTQQLNMYKFILESQYAGMEFRVGGIPYTRIYVETMDLVVFHESLTTYLVYKIPDVQSAICEQMKIRKNCLTKDI